MSKKRENKSRLHVARKVKGDIEKGKRIMGETNIKCKLMVESFACKPYHQMAKQNKAGIKPNGLDKPAQWLCVQTADLEAKLSKQTRRIVTTHWVIKFSK